jgi:hypothetical protein
MSNVHVFHRRDQGATSATDRAAETFANSKRALRGEMLRQMDVLIGLMFDDDVDSTESEIIERLCQVRIWKRDRERALRGQP